ncbi:hypothetical protein M902_2086 [Bacteriovorax sp. BAL6_X]|uniref:hypothetical protein n=1 Tax=Bacteriovorax sp. BAL6_X TaxID=1201290 RepID=UPI000385D4D0|nr:hypothetical protein [Bacteriovorax sp. BAL6_X]EPZ51975.1 hypothetical protein M902_2086 [Bacteriovorax sp. BAL6_X]
MLEKINGKQIDAHLLSSLLQDSSVDGDRESRNLSFYDIIYVIDTPVDIGPRFKTNKIDEAGVNVTLAFTDKVLCNEYLEQNSRIRAITVGMLCGEVESNFIEVIGLNRNSSGRFEEFIFVPPYDKLTCQYILSPRDETISLLSIDNESHRFMGVEATFFSITNKTMVTFGQGQRDEYLNNLIENLSFIIPRIPQRRGSANIICLLLNLENSIEEKAFVRDYPTFEGYTEVLFVNSNLELLTGNLTRIEYDGASLEGIYLPLIERAKKLKSHLAL